jgi:acetyl esterase/lipase
VMNGVVDAYYENQEKAKQNEPTTIARTQKDKVKSLPPWLLIEAENEPQFILKGSELFTAGLAENGKSVDRIPAKGHNHLSTTFVLGTGDKEGEKWAADFVAWAKKL